MQEIWKDIVGYENKYQISNKGNVKRTLKNGEVRNVKTHIRGRYLVVSMQTSENGKTKYECQYVHRLVALHFIPNPKRVNFVNHIDGNVENNNVDNLEWVSNNDNLKHASNTLGHHPFGHKPRKVNQLTLDGEIINTFDSIGKATEDVKKTIQLLTGRILASVVATNTNCLWI